MAAKQSDAGSSRAATPAPAPSAETGRKPWKKRSPVEVMLAQIEKIREDVTQKEEELKTAKRQLAKLEEVRKALEST